MQGFKGNCLVFGTPLALVVRMMKASLEDRTLIACLVVIYTSFSASIDKTYEDKVISLSTNTGGKCRFYK